MAYIINVQNLTKAFDGNVVLDNISFNVNTAENLVVFGRSGTGKSVLLKCMIGLMIPDGGKIYIEDKLVHTLNISELNELRKDIGFLFQGGALYDSMTVRENLSFPLIRNYNFTKTIINEKVAYTLDLVGLLSAIDKMPSELSGGMRKRIALARSIITEPKIMFYDEPTTGLDPLTTKEISELILDLQNKLNMTSIAVTHDLTCANIIADRAIFLRDAKIKYEGTIKELTDSDDLFLRNFFSTEKINV